MPILLPNETPAPAPAPMRRRLVDYSDSESESDDDDNDAPPKTAPGATTTTDAEPKTENELAGIVIELQKKYIREIEEIGEEQAQWKREVQGWKAAFEEKWKLEQKLLRGLIKNVYGINVEEFLAKEGLLPGPNPRIETQGPPSPSPSPSILPVASPSGSRSLTPAAQQHEDLASRKSEPPAGKTSIAPVFLPQRARSTGKKAPRPNVAANRRPYQAKRKPTVTKSKPTEITSQPGIDTPVNGISSRPLGEHSEIRPHQLAPQAEPPNPYDDPKYFSSMTVTGPDGVERPIFKFYKHPDTVEEQWAEWKYGLHGQPPVEQLEDKYRARWRREAYSRSWFTRRKAFWDRMKQMMKEGKTEEEALNVMRSSAQAKGSVPGLVAALVAERGGKGGNAGKKRKRSRNLVGRRSRENSTSITDGEPDSDEGTDVSVRICPTMRKRVRLIDIEPVHDSDVDTPSAADDDDDEWVG